MLARYETLGQSFKFLHACFLICVGEWQLDLAHKIIMKLCERMWTWTCKLLSCIRLFAIPWTIALQAHLSMGFSSQGYWNGLPFPSPLVVLTIHSFNTTGQVVLGPSNARLIGGGRRPSNCSILPGLTAATHRNDLSPSPSNSYWLRIYHL